MNKQEVFDEVSTLEPEEQDFFTYKSEEELKAFKEGFYLAKCNAMLAIQNLEEPRKPVVPQYVADWYEAHKSHFENNLVLLIKKWFKGEVEDDNLFAWIGYDLCLNNPIQTLVAMHKYGYKIKGKKLYTVEFPIPDDPDNAYYALCKDKSGKISMIWTCMTDLKNLDMFHLTEEEIKEGFAWTWDLGYAEEVKE